MHPTQTVEGMLAGMRARLASLEGTLSTRLAALPVVGAEGGAGFSGTSKLAQAQAAAQEVVRVDI